VTTDGGFIYGLRNALMEENGAKMAGELTNTGVGPAVANAVYNAVGVRLTEFPITAERVYDALQTVKETTTL
jgi:CO/xanthine dehydrogenase Mo-binding subunit